MRQHEHVKHHSGRATSTVSPLVYMVSHACLRTHETRGAWPAIGAASRRMPNAIYLSIYLDYRYIVQVMPRRAPRAPAGMHCL